MTSQPPTAGAFPTGAVPTWEEVARSHGRFLYSVAYRLTSNHDDAQDLVQEVLVRVQRGLVTYRPGSLQGWLSRIATNAFLDDVRRRKRRPTEALPEEQERADRVMPSSMAADEQLAMDQLPAHIQDALRDLPDDYRAAVVLCDVVGLSYEGIAESLGVPVGTVRSRIHRGRSRLKAVLV
ncbi:MAG: sigma-70 family RNA polymerase sigma factor [Nitriliruptorales bacterium]